MRQHPGERLQELERVLCRVELVRAEDHDLARVRGDPVRDLVADPDAVGCLLDDRSQVERHLAALVETRSPPPSSTSTSVLCVSSSDTLKRRWKAGCSSARFTIWYDACRRPAVAAPDSPL